MCKKLEISRASYYKWLHRPIPDKEEEDARIAKRIQKIHDTYHGILGYRRMTHWINRQDPQGYGLKRIHRIMHILGIRSSIRRANPGCTVSNRTDEKAENILNRDFEAKAPNQKWTTDVTELKIPGANGKLYLSAFMDLYDRSIVAWAISERNDNKLVFDTFRSAIESYPDAHPLFHSDRGCQYTSPTFKEMIRDQGMTQSMSRVSCCLDNGPQEAFWGILKTEMPLLFPYHDKDSLIDSIHKYIHFYNSDRYQERFEDRAPMEVRNEAFESEYPKRYPIAYNPKIERYKQHLEDLRNKKSPTETNSDGLQNF